MLALLLLACASDGSGDTSEGKVGPDTGEAPGTLALSFRVDDDYLAAIAENGQTALGTFGGEVYAEDDASSVGPNEGAVALHSFSVEGVDLTGEGGPTGVLHVTDAFAPQIVWVLGCLDIDVPADGCGDVGDPITVPNENKVQVVGGAEAPFTVYMGMLRP
jgi:hypothetical protein